MNKWVITSLFAISTLSASVASALEVRYVATPQQSTWQMATNTPLECRLVHPIPNYGDAEFSSRAGKKINLDFELKMRRPMGDTRNVSLVSMPPVWRPGEGADRITNLQFFKQFDGYIGGQTAWSLLSELEKGRYPTSVIKIGKAAINVLRLRSLQCCFSNPIVNLVTVFLSYCLTALKTSRLRFYTTTKAPVLS